MLKTEALYGQQKIEFPLTRRYGVHGASRRKTLKQKDYLRVFSAYSVSPRQIKLSEFYSEFGYLSAIAQMSARQRS